MLGHAALSCVSPAPSTRQQALPESTPLPAAAATGTASLGCPDFAQMLTALPCNNKPRAKRGIARSQRAGFMLGRVSAVLFLSHNIPALAGAHREWFIRALTTS